MDVSSLHSILPADQPVPEWVQLVPGGTFSGEDGRGPYHLTNADAVITASMAGGKLVFDENHATDHALRTGAAAPARGWIVEMQNRNGSIWGKVEWTKEGVRLLTQKEYRGISPVFAHGETTGQVSRVLRAALTNAPNLTLGSLHHRQEDSMDLATKLRTALGLADTADEAAIVAAATAARTAVSTHATQLASIAAAAGAAKDANAEAIVTAVSAKGGKESLEQVVALQTQVQELQREQKHGRAVIAIDKAMAEGKPIPASKRDEFIALHMADPAGTEKWLEVMPRLNTGGAPPRPVIPAQDGRAALDDADQSFITMMGVDAAAFGKTKADAIAKGVFGA